jgi:diadenosine tetraphosphate (Ap4A) HIT family hydrolase
MIFMALVLETSHFRIVAPEQPHVSRGDGGHLIINPKVTVEDRTQLDRGRAVELVKLTMVAGEAMKAVLARKGIPIGRINYQDNGNWRHELHVHLYGRARDAKRQPWGQPLSFPPTADAQKALAGALEPLTADDITELAAKMNRLLASDKYRNF